MRTRATCHLLFISMLILGGLHACGGDPASGGGDPGGSGDAGASGDAGSSDDAGGMSDAGSSSDAGEMSDANGGLEDLIVTTELTLSASASYRHVIIKPTGLLTLENGLVIHGDLTVEAGGEMHIHNQMLHVAGDITNDGAVYDRAGIVLDGTAPQHITNHDGKGTFQDDPTKPTASFTALVIDNPSEPIAVTIDQGDGVQVDGAVFIGQQMDFLRGVLDVGIDNQFIMRKAVTSKRMSGGLLRGFGPGGGAQMIKQVGVGPSTFTFHLVDNKGDFQYSPVTVELKSQTYDGVAIVASVLDDVHPGVNTGGAPASSLTRYWWIIAHPVSGTYDARFTFTYQDEDVVGAEANLHPTFWNGSGWTEQAATVDPATNTFSLEIDETAFPNYSSHVTARDQ